MRPPGSAEVLARHRRLALALLAQGMTLADVAEVVGCAPSPVVRHRFRRDRLSVIGGLSVSPVAHRLHLHYDIHTKNIRQPEVCAFLRALLRSWRGPIMVLWDQGRIHRGAIIREFLARHPRVRVEAFPAYAPEPDPQEMAWAHAKARLANGAPSNRWELMAALVVAHEQLRRSQVESRACIHESELPWS